MQSAAFVLAHHGGIARGTLLSRYGLSRQTLSEEVAANRVVRVRQGVFALPSLHPDIVTAAQHGGALTCRRALRMHGVWVLDDDPQVHVWLGGRGRVHPHPGCDCLGHYFAGSAPLGLAPVDEVLAHTYTAHRTRSSSRRWSPPVRSERSPGRHALAFAPASPRTDGGSSTSPVPTPTAAWSRFSGCGCI